MKKTVEAQIYIASSGRSPIMALENKGKKKRVSLEELMKEAMGQSINIIHSQGLRYSFVRFGGRISARHPDRPPRQTGNHVYFSNTDGERFDNIAPYAKKVKITIEIE